ncbi:bifunctional UDP-sugar hydrolase/5'-nucleotidase [uncultured Corynebacterium sp.]|uniref:bifunctional metallophosphatase/5'-nucleotidase n=1 Tax=uncultured Corynebacterium sp. TaxID=159447 RepID=UPI0025EE210B|nr:5'-nucleotidase C-terminal domain-containing protein [uncultured Corynebacterium sp.]
MRKTQIAIAVLTVITLTPANGMAADSAPAHPTVATGDVVYFQDMKEFEPRVWDDGSQQGGIAYLATAFDTLRKEEGDPIVAFGGELAAGSLFGSVFRGEPFVEAFNELGVDVGNFGNHDFDYGLDHTRNLIEKAEFPWISSNLTTENGEPISEDGTTYTAKSGELTVGFVSLTADLDRTVAAKEVVMGDFVDSTRAGVDKLEEEGVDAIVLLSQISKEDTTRVMEEVPELAAALREENEAQSPEEITYTADRRPIVAPRADYGTLVHLDITVDRSIQKRTVKVVNHPVNPSFTANEEWKARSQKLYGELDRQLGEELGTATQPLSKAELGPLVADAYREHFDTQLGWQNGGGQRADMKEGVLTRRDAQSVLPFGNSPISIQATGAQIKDALEKGIESNPDGGNGFPRTAGFTFEYDLSAPFGERVSAIKLDDGTPMEMESTYSLAISNYVVNGGDKVDSFADAPVTSEGTAIDVDVFSEYIKRHRELSPLKISENPNGPANGGKTGESSIGSSHGAAVAIGVIAVLAGVLVALTPKSVLDGIVRYLRSLLPSSWQ